MVESILGGRTDRAAPIGEVHAHSSAELGDGLREDIVGVAQIARPFSNCRRVRPSRDYATLQLFGMHLKIHPVGGCADPGFPATLDAHWPTHALSHGGVKRWAGLARVRAQEEFDGFGNA